MKTPSALATGLLTVVLVLTALPGVRPAAHAATATEALRPAVEQVVAILADPEMKGPDRTAVRRAAIHETIERMVDFPDAARRALGVHWAARTVPERERFVPLFADLIVLSYTRHMETYAGEKVVFVGESVDEDVTTVLTRIESPRRGTFRVDYRMHRVGPDWRIYDVLIEGVSLVNNYRAQFNTVIRTSSFADLVRRMQDRVEELRAPPASTTAGGASS